jgi:SMI1-KNR4 cell-wall
MAVADVTALIPSPAFPNQVGSLDEWRAVERELGVTLPLDFREFVFTYGTGQLGRFYSVWNPFWGSEFVQQVRLICGYERESQQQFPQYFPYSIYPESPGFLPWGSDDNGNYYGWLTEGPPDRWPVLSNEVRGGGYRLHRCTMTEYLGGVFRGEIIALAGEYPGQDDLVFRG